MKIASIVADKAELVLIGRTIGVENHGELLNILDYVKGILGVDYVSSDVLQGALKYCAEGCVKFISMSTIEDTILITLLLDTAEEPLPQLDAPDGVFGYVYNVSYPVMSKLGYSFYRKSGSSYKRIG